MVDHQIYIGTNDFEEIGDRMTFEIVRVENVIVVKKTDETLVFRLPLDHFGKTADESLVGRKAQLVRHRVKQEKICEIIKRLERGWNSWELTNDSQ